MRFLSHDPSAEDTRKLEERLACLEEKLELMQQQLKQLVIENKKLRRDMKFFELMLLEEYHLLIQLLGRDQGDLSIHSIRDSPASRQSPNSE
ncbi:DUF5320 domain-containing protein [Lihuaxuella thermophila]|uniref:Uncharacterized protein n=1 Tax=Lihuaxuella thermophila TaxID=1173111 RepID=A0A1H8AIY8_9BACL|nr:DUF5320 domain-containing protein [Lihuaxuella thermophila]SEM69487.1 hypothetical protein SAMN05444955_101122 [Lihuaxuella thermophila]